MEKSKSFPISSPTLDKLEVTVIPVDDEPYSKMISIPTHLISKFS